MESYRARDPNPNAAHRSKQRSVAPPHPLSPRAIQASVFRYGPTQPHREAEFNRSGTVQPILWQACVLRARSVCDLDPWVVLVIPHKDGASGDQKIKPNEDWNRPPSSLPHTHRADDRPAALDEPEIAESQPQNRTLRNQIIKTHPLRRLQDRPKEIPHENPASPWSPGDDAACPTASDERHQTHGSFLIRQLHRAKACISRHQ